MIHVFFFQWACQQTFSNLFKMYLDKMLWAKWYLTVAAGTLCTTSITQSMEAWKLEQVNHISKSCFAKPKRLVVSTVLIKNRTKYFYISQLHWCQVIMNISLFFFFLHVEFTGSLQYLFNHIQPQLHVNLDSHCSEQTDMWSLLMDYVTELSIDPIFSAVWISTDSSDGVVCQYNRKIKC